MKVLRIITLGAIAALISGCVAPDLASRADENPGRLTETDMVRSVMMSL